MRSLVTEGRRSGGLADAGLKGGEDAVEVGGRELEEGAGGALAEDVDGFEDLGLHAGAGEHGLVGGEGVELRVLVDAGLGDAELTRDLGDAMALEEESADGIGRGVHGEADRSRTAHSPHRGLQEATGSRQ